MTSRCSRNFLIRFSSILFLTFFFFISDSKCQFVLHFCNNNQTKVDSIEISLFDTIMLKKTILQGDCISFKVPNEWTNRHGAVKCNYKIYFGYNYINGQRLKGTFNDTVFLEKDIQQEPIVEIFINNVSNQNIDSIIAAGHRIEKPKIITPRVQSFEIKYQDLVSNSIVEIFINKAQKKVILIRQDFANLYIPIVNLWLNDSLFLKGIPPFNSIKEFNITFQSATTEINLEKMNLVSSSLITESKSSDKYFKTYVFDFKKLKQNPSFKVLVGQKKYKVKLTKKDLSSVYNGYKYFWVSEKEIKPEN